MFVWYPRRLIKDLMKPFLFIAGFILSFCNVFSQKGALIDRNATRETIALYKNLKKLSDKHTLFGHQHATEYGHGWEGDENRLDVKWGTGNHPAVIGIDFSGFTYPDKSIA